MDDSLLVTFSPKKVDRTDDLAQPECKHIRQEEDVGKENEVVAHNGKGEESLPTAMEC